MRALFLGVAAATPSVAHAGAWSADNQTIVSGALGERNGVQFAEADLYHERHISGRWGMITQGHADFANDYDPAGWRGEALSGLKWTVAKPANGALAVQAALTWSYEPSAACDGEGGEVRAMGGRSWGNVFVNAEAAYLIRGPGCDHGRFDFTTGWKPNERWLILGQAFVDRDLSLGGTGQQTEKLQLSAVRFNRSGRGLQFGVRHSLGGVRDELALVVGWWSPS